MSHPAQKHSAQSGCVATGTAPNVEAARTAMSPRNAKQINAASGEKATFRAALAKAHALACTRQTPILLSVALRISALNLVEIFAASVDTERFLFEQPAQGFGLLGLGSAVVLEAHDASRFAAIRRQVTSLTQNVLRCGDALCTDSESSLFTPKFVGGFAFEDRSRPSQTWTAFPHARFVLPQIQIEIRGEVSGAIFQALIHRETNIDDIAQCWQDHHAKILDATNAPLQATRTKQNSQKIQPQNGTDLQNEILPTLPESVLCATSARNSFSTKSTCTFFSLNEDPLDRSDPLRNEKSSQTPREPSPAVREHYLAIVRKALAAIERGELEKSVVARSTTLFCRETLAPERMLRKLRDTYPRCTLFAVTHGVDTFLGATPERLVSLEKQILHIDALAGSAPRGLTPEIDTQKRHQLKNSRKERHEHTLVVQSIRDAIESLCETLQIPDSPCVLALDAIQHLHSPITGRAVATNTVLDFVEALHPTAAISGAPREAAKRWLAENEELERGWYSGPVGWFDTVGSGDFSVALRCALLKPTQALFFAGAGIVADSNPEQELEETRLKLRASLLAFLEIEA